MKKQILIVGSGFAGMWAAVSAARLSEKQGNNSLEIAVLAPNPNSAFGHASMRRRCQRWSPR